MKRIWLFVAMGVLFFAATSDVWSAGTTQEAKAMVEKAIAFYKANGKEKVLAEISNPTGQFAKDDLCVTVYDMNGKCLAHGFNKSMIGMDLMTLKDPDGKFFVKERVELARTKGKSWQDYKFTNPLSKKVENKSAWIEKVDDTILACGAYK